MFKVNITRDVFNLLTNTFTKYEIPYNIIDEYSSEEDYFFLKDNHLLLFSRAIGDFDCYKYYYNSIEARLNKKSLLSDLIFQNKEKRTDLTVLDVFAGFGRDSFNFLYYGCDVTAIEFNPYIFIILSYLNDLYYKNFGKKLNLFFVDAYKFLESVHKDNQQQLLKRYDLVYVDPMFEDNRSALPAKDMQVISHFNKLMHESCNFKTLPEFNLSLFSQLMPTKLIIKRDNKQDPLISKVKPNFSKLGKCIRFDIYLI